MERKPGHYLREWREHADLTLEQVSERLELLAQERMTADPAAGRVGTTHQNLGKVERGVVPYSQALIELLAEIYRTDPASLIMRDPADSEGLWSIWDQLKGPQRRQLVEFAKVIQRTGTGG